MKSRSWSVLFAVLFVFAGCGDDDADCPSGDPCECWGECLDADGGRDGDVRPDGDTRQDDDGDTPAGHGYLTVRSLPAETAGAAVLVDDTERCVTPCENLELEGGTHAVRLSLVGWVDSPTVRRGIPRQVEIVNGNLTEISVMLGRDIMGRWRGEVTGDVQDVEMFYEADIPSCPNTRIAAGPFDALGGLCVAGLSLSLCENHASECGDLWAEGQISPDGQRLEFTFYPGGGDPPEHYVYVNLSD